LVSFASVATTAIVVLVPGQGGRGSSSSPASDPAMTVPSSATISP
jgi:hypothetical protein